MRSGVATSLLPLPGLGDCVCLLGERNQDFRKSKSLDLPERKLWDTRAGCVVEQPKGTGKTVRVVGVLLLLALSSCETLDK